MSKRKPVLPTLTALIRGGVYEEECGAELRAAEAVIWAAKRVASDTVGDADAVEHLCALDRALTRLEKARTP